ncbi:MAG: DinB family protein [Gemmatimonadales bacterium]
MSTRLRPAAAIAALFAISLGLPAQAPAQQPTGVVADLLKDMSEVEKKLVDLAKAMPENTYAWRAGKARTTAEVFQHVAAENYFLPTAVGVTAPAATKIKGDDYATVQAHENRKAGRDEVIADLERSFAHFKAAMGKTTPAELSQSLSIFGMTMTRQQFWIMTTMHLHEHLGQAIAYARANDIVPPWSR